MEHQQSFAPQSICERNQNLSHPSFNLPQLLKLPHHTNPSEIQSPLAPQAHDLATAPGGWKPHDPHLANRSAPQKKRRSYPTALAISITALEKRGWKASSPRPKENSIRGRECSPHQHSTLTMHPHPAASIPGLQTRSARWVKQTRVGLRFPTTYDECYHRLPHNIRGRYPNSDLRVIEVEEEDERGGVEAVDEWEKKKVVRDRAMGWQGGTSAYLGI